MTAFSATCRREVISTRFKDENSDENWGEETRHQYFTIQWRSFKAAQITPFRYFCRIDTRDTGLSCSLWSHTGKERKLGNCQKIKLNAIPLRLLQQSVDVFHRQREKETHTLCIFRKRIWNIVRRLHFPRPLFNQTLMYISHLQPGQATIISHYCVRILAFSGQCLLPRWCSLLQNKAFLDFFHLLHMVDTTVNLKLQTCNFVRRNRTKMYMHARASFPDSEFVAAHHLTDHYCSAWTVTPALVRGNRAAGRYWGSGRRVQEAAPSVGSYSDNSTRQCNDSSARERYTVSKLQFVIHIADNSVKRPMTTNPALRNEMLNVLSLYANEDMQIRVIGQSCQHPNHYQHHHQHKTADWLTPTESVNAVETPPHT